MKFLIRAGGGEVRSNFSKNCVCGGGGAELLMIHIL